MKKNIIFLMIGMLISGTIAFAVVINASEITYKDTTVEEAINDLYTNPATNKFCKLIGGNLGEVSSKYECDPGDGTKRNFYLLAKNPSSIELIMEHNITEGSDKTMMTWYDAMNYIKDNNLKTSWKNVMDINLPSAQVIANAVGNTSWDMSRKNYYGWFSIDKDSSGNYGQTQVANASNPSNYQWLFNYTRECTNYGCDSSTSLETTEAYGYWTRDVVAVQIDSIGRAWRVARTGNLSFEDLTNGTYFGVRPVITVLKENLYSE